MLQATSNIIIMASAIKVCVYYTKAQKIVKNNNILYIGRIIELLVFLVSFEIHTRVVVKSPIVRWVKWTKLAGNKVDLNKRYDSTAGNI